MHIFKIKINEIENMCYFKWDDVLNECFNIVIYNEEYIIKTLNIKSFLNIK